MTGPAGIYSMGEKEVSPGLTSGFSASESKDPNAKISYGINTGNDGSHKKTEKKS